MTGVRLVDLWLAVSLFAVARACTGGQSGFEVDGGLETPKATTARQLTTIKGDGDVVSDRVGDGVNTFDYDPAGYNSKSGGPVDSGANLFCNFDSGPCCWKNAQPPLDQLEWQSAVGIPEQHKMHINFGPFGPLDEPPPSPSGRYLLVSVTDAAASDEAQFVSCSITCSNDVIRVRARHWTTENTLLQVCTRASFFGSPTEAPLLNCQELPRSNSPGPTEVRLPPNSLVDVVFVASNMVGERGDIAILDDIEVQFDPCDAAQETTTAPTEQTESSQQPSSSTEGGGSDGPPAECQSIPCSFESGDCGYKNVGSGDYNTEMTVQSGRLGNPLTGIFRAAVGKTYLAAYMHKGAKAAVSKDVDVSSDNILISFQRVEATSGLELRACCDAADNCPWKSERGVDPTKRFWFKHNFSCPAGTKKILFVCENSNGLQGACGIDDIKVLGQDGQEVC